MGSVKMIGIGIGVISIAFGISLGIFNTVKLTELETGAPNLESDTIPLTVPVIGAATDGTSTNTSWKVESDGSSTCFKTGGVHGGWDADCVSDEEIYVGGTSGDGTGGYTTFVYDTDDSVSTCTNSDNGKYLAGLSDSDNSPASADVDFAWFPSEGSVFESGTFIGVFADLLPTTDPIYKISIDDDGTVKYYKDNVLKYTSLKTATADTTYEFDSALLEITAKICNITINKNS